MELTLNLIWLAVAAASFMLVPKRSRLAWFVVIAVVALLFPIISASDDFNADRTFNDAAPGLVVSIVLAIAFIAIARLRSLPQRFYAVHVATPSDPRSPPVR